MTNDALKARIWISSDGDSRTSRFVMLGIVLVYIAVYHDLLLAKSIFTHDAIIWYGSFHYYVDSLANGHFPFWDPYMMTGTYFYPNISLLGLLDPTVLVCALAVKVLSLPLLTVFIYFRVFRLFLYAYGAYLLFRHIAKTETGAALAAGALLFAVAPAYCRTDGPVLPSYLTPFAFYFLLLLFEHIRDPKRYLYLALFSLTTGVIMNVYIPAYFLFNLVAFVLVLAALRLLPLKQVIQAFRDARLRWASAAAALLILMMAAPPLMVMLKDVSPSGELFPLVRVLQKNDGNFKKITVSDLSESAFSNKYHDQKAIFSTYGNMVSMLYPDLLKSFTYWANHDGMSEIDQYFGIIPFILGIIGVMYSTSRYRFAALAMMALTFVNMFSFTGFYSRPYNALQKALNELFPPLKMIEVRELFGTFFLLYACLLVALGLKVVLRHDTFNSLVKTKYRQILAICAGVVAVKIVLAGYFEGKVLVTSVHDLGVMLLVGLFAGVVHLYRKGIVTPRLLLGFLMAGILVDLYAYNKYFTDETYERNVLQDSDYLFRLADTKRIDAYRANFQYFRNPLATPPGIAFGDSILKTKGAFTYGNNHTIFSTKRFYDYYTHVPLQNQFLVSGVVNPIIGFFPQNAITPAQDKKEVLNYFAGARESDLWGRVLIEQNNGRSVQAVGAEQLGDLRQYEDVPALQPQAMVRFVSEYYTLHEKDIQSIRGNLDSMLQTPDYFVKVSAFSPNELTVAVANRIDGYLLYNDGWSRYWQAFDNDREVPIRVANYNFKAVYLPPGRHHVRFAFNPLHYKIGLVLYYLGLLVSAGLSLFFFRRKNILPSDETATSPVPSRLGASEGAAGGRTLFGRTKSCLNAVLVRVRGHS